MTTMGILNAACGTRRCGATVLAGREIAATNASGRFEGRSRCEGACASAAAGPSRRVRPGLPASCRATATSENGTAAEGASASAADGAGAVVFVAGATGRTGSRAVKELLASGYRVRAGVRSAAKFTETFSSVGQEGGLERVTFDVMDGSDAAMDAAVAGADAVVCCLGAPETEFNPSNPRLIDGEGVTRLVAAAKRAGSVKHFVLVSSLGTGKFGWPAASLNLFFGVLHWKREGELALIRSGLPYTIVRPGGMERPTDDYYKTHNLVLGEADARFGGQVSRLQVSWVVRESLLNPALSANKVVEVVAEEKAKKKEITALLDGVKSQGAIVEGSAAWYSLVKYPHAPRPLDAVFGTMGFGGAGPEAINGRLAMLGVVSMLGYEWRAAASDAHALSLASQIGSPGILAPTLAIAALITTASLVPLAKDVSPKDAQVPVFSAAAERINGRAAMLAFAYLAWIEGVEGRLAKDAVGSFVQSALHPQLGWDIPTALGLVALVAVTTLAASAVPLAPSLAAALAESSQDAEDA